MSSSIGIVYNGGSYGTYLHWLIFTLTTDFPIMSPLTSATTSHEFEKNVAQHTSNYSDMTSGYSLKEFNKLSNNQIPKLFRIHPKIYQTESAVYNIEKIILPKVSQLLIAYPDPGSYLLNVNNYMYKIWNDLWSGPLKYINKDDLYNNFAVDPSTPLAEIDRAIIREYLSFNVFSSWESQVEWFLPNQLHHSRCHFVYLNDLLYRPVETLAHIKKFCNLTWTKDVNSILDIHYQNLKTQKFLTQDSLAYSILTAIDRKQNFEWEQSDLTLITEAWIQCALRKQGKELQCDQLSVFPTSTLELANYII
jgi:hypothetical protein